jgi:hypothetical protein
MAKYVIQGELHQVDERAPEKKSGGDAVAEGLAVLALMGLGSLLFGPVGAIGAGVLACAAANGEKKK